MTGAPTSEAKRPGKRHVLEADVLRILTFACVIAVHTTANTNTDTNVVAGALAMLLHFTREAFFWLTGFVLTLQYGRRSLDVPKFWRRRFWLVGTPYLVWSGIYLAIAPRPVLPALFEGKAYYHLYFLLVSLQVYLIFPALAALIRRTVRWHWLLLAVAALYQLGYLYLARDAAPATGPVAVILRHDDIMLFSYVYYLVFGALCAWHLDRILGWVARFKPAVAVAVLISGAAAEAAYLHSVHAGQKASTAAAVLQPIMLLWSTAIIAGLFAVGVVVSDRAGAATRRFISWASDRSFAIFLVHPAVLSLLLTLGITHGLPRPWVTVVAYVAVVLAAAGLAELMRRTPMSLPLTGRPRLASQPVPDPRPFGVLPRARATQKEGIRT